MRPVELDVSEPRYNRSVPSPLHWPRKIRMAYGVPGWRFLPETWSQPVPSVNAVIVADPLTPAVPMEARHTRRTVWAEVSGATAVRATRTMAHRSRDRLIARRCRSGRCIGRIIGRAPDGVTAVARAYGRTWVLRTTPDEFVVLGRPVCLRRVRGGSPGRPPRNSPSSESEAIPEAQLHLVGESRGRTSREAVDQARQERPPETDGRPARRDMSELRGDLDRSLQVTDLVDETELECLLAQPHLARCQLADPLLTQPATCGDAPDERCVERLDDLLLLVVLFGAFFPPRRAHPLESSSARLADVDSGPRQEPAQPRPRRDRTEAGSD